VLRFRFNNIFMGKIKILLADDHLMFREGLKAILEETPSLEVLAQASNGKQVLKLLETIKVDLIMLDLHMPVMNGTECMKEINNQYPDLPVIVLTMAADVIHIRNILAAGAKGYLLKNSSGAELLKAIEKVLSGEQYYDNRVSQIILDDFSGKKQSQVSEQSPKEILTNREIQILKMIAREESNKDIAQKLFISIRTVDAHRRNLLQKTGAKNTAGLTRYAIEHFGIYKD
jgi:DNA-binding NarL/FixJ family response regulator